MFNLGFDLCGKILAGGFIQLMAEIYKGNKGHPFYKAAKLKSLKQMFPQKPSYAMY